MFEVIARRRFAASAVALALIAFARAEAHADPQPVAAAAVAACADAAEHGQELRATQKLVEARASFVTCAQRDCPAAVRSTCTEWLADLDRRLPSLVIGAKDERGHDVRDVVATLDGVRLPDIATSAAVPANPGPHTLRCEAPGHDPSSDDVVLREGEPLRVIAVTLRTTGAAAPAPAAAAPDVIGPPPAAERPAARPFPVVPVVLGGVAVVALGVFAVAAGTGASDYHSLESDCSPHCSSDRIDSVRTRFVVADVALVVGIVTGVGALGWWLFDRPQR
jgi:hypothetical protein